MSAIGHGYLFIGRFTQVTNQVFDVFPPNESVPRWCALEISGHYTIIETVQHTYRMTGIELRVNFTGASLSGVLLGKDPIMRFTSFDDSGEIRHSFTYRVEYFPPEFSPRARVDFKYQDKRSGKVYSGYQELSLSKYARGSLHTPGAGGPLLSGGVNTENHMYW
ncbi:MAG: hypothetical protein MN733_43095 [Nitrososphaera sp.]|nr:hypothetical protein [Nitrososphaera sp.]MCI0611302.1 hypothetical protein [Anaerolineae bacterium]